MFMSCSSGSAWWDTRYKKIYVTIDEISEWLIFSWWIFSLIEEFEHGGSMLHGQAYNCFSLSLQFKLLRRETSMEDLSQKYLFPEGACLK